MHTTTGPIVQEPAVTGATRRRNFGSQPMVTYAERFECPRCYGCIPASHVVRHPTTEGDALTNSCRISIICPACRSCHRGVFRLCDGLLSPVAIEPVTDVAEVGVLRSGIDQRSGDVQLRHDVTSPGLPRDPREPRDEPTAEQVRAEPSEREMELSLLVISEARHREAARKSQQIADSFGSRIRRVAHDMARGRRRPPGQHVEAPPAAGEPDSADLQRMATDYDAAASGAAPETGGIHPGMGPTAWREAVLNRCPTGKDYSADVLDAALLPAAKPEPVLDRSTSQVDGLPDDEPFDVDGQHGDPRPRG